MSDLRVQLQNFLFFEKNCIRCEAIILSFKETYLHFEALSDMHAIFLSFLIQKWFSFTLLLWGYEMELLVVRN